MELGLELEESLKSRLRAGSPWAHLNDEEFAQLFKHAQQVQLSLGDLLDTETPNRVSILVAGKIRLLQKLSDGSESNIYRVDGIGECWSESWLESKGNITVRASEPAVVLRLDEGFISGLAAHNQLFSDRWQKLKQQWKYFFFLHQTPPFADLAASHLRIIAHYFKQVSVKSVQNELAAQAGLFVIAFGSVECDDTDGRKPLFPGQHFIQGEFGPVKGSVSKVGFLEPAELLVLTAEEYMVLCNHDPEAAQALMACLDPKAAAAMAGPVTVLAPPPAAVDTHRVAEHSEIKWEDESLTGKVGKLLHQYPFIMQQSQMDCGITCLAMVALYYGKRLDINELRERAEVSIEGTSMLSLAETAEHVGFMARGIRGTYEGLLSARLPLICFWKENHFVVLYEINKREARIGDPAEGVISISREEFSRDFSKSALELIPTVELKRAPGAKSPLTILLPLLKPYGPQIRDVLLVGVVYQALMIITPFFSQTIIDRVIVHEDISMLNMLLMGMILIVCFQSALTFARGILISTLSAKIDHALIVQFYKHLFSLPLKFFEQRSTGDILARFNENARITAFLSGSTITVLLDANMTIIFLAVLFYYNWQFGLATVIYVVLLGAATIAYTPLLRGFSNELFKKTVANDSSVIESVHGVEKIKSAAAENRTRWKWEIIFVDKLSVSFRQQLAYNGYSQITQLVHLAGRILLMWLGAHLVIAKTFTVGQYMAANMMSGMVVDPIMRVIAMWQQLQGVNISIERLGDVFRAVPEQTGVKTNMPDIQGLIEFRNVSFRYNEHSMKNALMNISLKVQPNQMVAVVGRSGCGKTTLARLIQGLYLPSSGDVLIDGVDTRQIELSDLRKKIGVVAQQEFFFSGTVRENIAFYMPDSPMEEIIAVAKIAGIHERIQAMGSGYSTMLNEGGLNLSGGERQRLAIARALLHNPRIVIFDEATSALDSESERHIQSCMDAVRKGRTMVVIAHRMSTIKSADLILVMDQGQLVEAGNHEALLQQKKLYYHLCSQQSI